MRGLGEWEGALQERGLAQGADGEMRHLQAGLRAIVEEIPAALQPRAMVT